jgi:hypothetical protein
MTFGCLLTQSLTNAVSQACKLGGAVTATYAYMGVRTLHMQFQQRISVDC